MVTIKLQTRGIAFSMLCWMGVASSCVWAEDTGSVGTSIVGVATTESTGLSTASVAEASEPPTGKLSLGLGYPYVSVKCDFSKLAFEGRYTATEGIFINGVRGYWKFHRSPKLIGFVGLEAGVIRFNTLGIKGNGKEFAAFVGGDYFLSDTISLQMDLAPTYISLTESGSSKISAGNLYWVANMGLYIHFNLKEWAANTNTSSRNYSEDGNATPSDDFHQADAPVVSRSSVSSDALAEDAEAVVVEPPADDEKYKMHLDMAGAYFKQGNYAAALSEYSLALKAIPSTDPRGVSVLERQGMVATKAKNMSSAKDFYAKAIRLAVANNVHDRNVVNAYCGLAYYYEQAGDVSLAISTYYGALRQNVDEKMGAKIQEKIDKLKASGY